MKLFYNFIFKYISLSAVFISFLFLVFIFSSIIKKGYKAFYSSYLVLDITLTPNDVNQQISIKKNIIFSNEVNKALNKISQRYNINFVDFNILSIDYNRELNKYLKKNPDNLNKTIKIPLLLNSNADIYLKNYKRAINNLSKDEIKFLYTVKKYNLIKYQFSWQFFKNGDSRFPEIAGISGALKGTMITIFLTTILSFIIGVGTAIYTEEYLTKGVVKSLIEININNLAAVPSIIFGLLGLSLFQNIMCIPRASPLLASMVLTLMIIPNIIVYGQLAWKSVPLSIKEAAYGIGASKNQVIFKHIFPIALPGIITGLIIGISRAIGETAPLLIIGLYIFVSNNHFTILEASSTLPTQILMWFNMPEVGYTEKASAAIIILLSLTISINLIASYIRKKFTKKL